MGVACRGAPRLAPAIAASTALVSQFVAAETSGHAERAESLVDRRSCEGDGGWDFLAVTRQVQIERPLQYRDTTLVPVTYSWAGQWWSEDPHQVGFQSARFTALDTTDSVPYRVVADSAGRLWIACGDFYEGHLGVSQLLSDVPRFDAKSLAAWKAARLPVR